MILGLIKGKSFLITEEILSSYKNQGGFDLLGTGRDKIKSDSDYEGCVKSCKDLQLTGLVIVGGDDSNTNAAQLAEYLKEKNVPVNVVGVPKTIDGDLKGNGIEISFGHDTCGKIFSELVGNISTDNESTKKYYSFVRLMGRDASHITLEVALRTQPNIAFISEEVGAAKKGLKEIISEITDMVKERAKKGKNYGVVLIPEGIVGFIPEFSELINELNIILAKESTTDHSKISSLLKENSKNLFEFLPNEIKDELLQERDSHGNVQLSKVETERLFGKLAEHELKKEKISFAVNLHFFGYEGRCGLPSNFDCDYGFTLGHTAGLLLNKNLTGVMCGVRNLTQQVSDWEVFGLPLTSLMTIEKRSGVDTPVIKKALVDLNSKSFLKFSEERKKWLYEDCYSSPGPIQFYGKSSQDKSRILMIDEGK